MIILHDIKRLQSCWGLRTSLYHIKLLGNKNNTISSIVVVVVLLFIHLFICAFMVLSLKYGLLSYNVTLKQ